MWGINALNDVVEFKCSEAMRIKVREIRESNDNSTEGKEKSKFLVDTILNLQQLQRNNVNYMSPSALARLETTEILH